MRAKLVSVLVVVMAAVSAAPAAANAAEFTVTLNGETNFRTDSANVYRGRLTNTRSGTGIANQTVIILVDGVPTGPTTTTRDGFYEARLLLAHPPVTHTLQAIASVGGNQILSAPLTVEVARFALATFIGGIGGSGQISSEPEGIACENDCSQEFLPGTVVTLTATAHQDSSFWEWQGACSGTSPTCTLVMNTDHLVWGMFMRNPQVFVEMTGAGAVTSDPAGIDCHRTTWPDPLAGTCSARFQPGTLVTLAAQPAVGYRFASWTGRCTGWTEPTCTFPLPPGTHRVDVRAGFEPL